MNQSYKKWHLNAGGDDEGVLNYQSFVSNNYGAITSCDEIYERDYQCKTKRCAMLDHFVKNARKGDLIFLKDPKKSQINYWASYQGVIKSFHEGYENPSVHQNPKGWEKYKKDPKYNYIIEVDLWHPMTVPYPAPQKRRATLYEVSDSQEYIIN